MQITYPDAAIFLGNDDVKNAFYLIKNNPVVVGMYGFSACKRLAFCTGMSFRDVYPPMSFDPLAVA